MILPGSAWAADSADSICAAGASEPPLVWYSSQDPSRNEAAVKAFREKYPSIKVEAFRLATGPLATRYASERGASVINADIITLADPIFVAQGFDREWFVSFSKSDLPALQNLDDKWFNRGAATTSISVLGISYNSKRVGDDPPKKWEDLLKPKYRGQIILGDPRSIPSYMALFRILREKLGDDFLKNLAAQRPVVVPSVVPSTQQAAAGEVAVVVPNVMTVVTPLKSKGAPIEFVAPDLTTGNEFETLLSKGADSPNAARCLYNFLFTAEGQVAYNGPTSVSPISSVTGTAMLPGNYINPRISELPQHEAALIQLLGLK
jgi:iron(III) transport system substrate-binding protein